MIFMEVLQQYIFLKNPKYFHNDSVQQVVAQVNRHFQEVRERFMRLNYFMQHHELPLDLQDTIRNVSWNTESDLTLWFPVPLHIFS